MPRSEQDRLLEQYEQEQDKFKALSEFLGNSDPTKMTDKEIVNTAGERTKPLFGGTPFNWQRNTERDAANLLANKIYKQDDPVKLAEMLRDRSGINYEIEPDEALATPGEYDPTNKVLKYNPNPKFGKTDLLETMIHESKHASDRKDDSVYTKDPHTIQEGSAMTATIPEYKTANITRSDMQDKYKLNPAIFPEGERSENWKRAEMGRQANLNEAQDEGDLHRASRINSKGHFGDPGSATLNTMTSEIRNIGQNPTTNPKYQELGPLLQQPSVFDKLKSYLRK